MTESYRVEYKQTLTDSLEKEVVAFLNYHEEKALKLNDRFASNLELLTEDGYCSLIKATKRVLEKLEIENKTAALITSTTRKEQPLWNKVALREAVINAMVHNDYTTENPPVFEIFSDRIEITSTGGLSVIKNIEDFFSGYSKPTCRELMRIYKDLELVEHLGSGLNRILETYTQECFIIKQNYMKNVFYKNEKPLDVGVNVGVNVGANVGVNEVFEYIKKHQPVKASIIAENFPTVTKRTIERWLKQLKDEQKIEFQGAPKTGGYFTK